MMSIRAPNTDIPWCLPFNALSNRTRMMVLHAIIYTTRIECSPRLFAITSDIIEGGVELRGHRMRNNKTRKLYDRVKLAGRMRCAINIREDA